MAHSNNLIDQVDLIKCGDICRSREIITVRGSMTLNQAWEIMHTRGVTCLPVLSNNQFIGFIDISMLAFLVAFKKWPSDNSRPLDPNTRVDLDKIIVSELLENSNFGGRLWKFLAVEPVHSLIEALSKGVHRALIENQGSCSIISQTDVIQWIAENKAFVPILDRSVASLAFPSIKITSISDTQTALEGFRLMTVCDTSSVAILNRQGKLVGNMSASDLKGIHPETVPKLELTVVHFLQDLHPSSLQPVIVKDADSLRSVLQKMINNHIHRVWLVDSEQRPQACISMTDVLTKFTRYAPEMQYSPSSLA